MARASRQSVFQALFNQVLTANTNLPASQQWVTTSRRWKSWDKVPSGSQPAMFQHQLPQETEQPTLGAAQWKWDAALWIYFRVDGSSDPTVIPDDVVNTYLDAIEAALTPAYNGQQTLGGLVYHCYINGQVYFDSGVLDGQAVILIPITILIGA